MFFQHCRNFRVTLCLGIKTSRRAKTFHMKMSFITVGRIHCHMYGFARWLVLIPRQKATRRWPVDEHFCVCQKNVFRCNSLYHRTWLISVYFRTISILACCTVQHWDARFGWSLYCNPWILCFHICAQPTKYVWENHRSGSRDSGSRDFTIIRHNTCVHTSLCMGER